MSSRWEKQVLERVIAVLDPDAVGGREIRLAGLDPRVFDSLPDSHAEPTASACREVYDLMRSAAQADRRLADKTPLANPGSLRQISTLRNCSGSSKSTKRSIFRDPGCRGCWSIVLRHGHHYMLLGSGMKNTHDC